ncbi:MAG: hypothetical protein WKH64_07095 [Chloroflexia bacterium]
MKLRSGKQNKNMNMTIKGSPEWQEHALNRTSDGEAPDEPTLDRQLDAQNLEGPGSTDAPFVEGTVRIAPRHDARERRARRPRRENDSGPGVTGPHRS